MKTKKTKNNLTYWFGVIVLGLSLGLALQFVQAWTEPSQAPPGGNLGAPLNTSEITQTKRGQLIINSDRMAGSGLTVYGQMENLGSAISVNGVYNIEGGGSFAASLPFNYSAGSFGSPRNSAALAMSGPGGTFAGGFWGENSNVLLARNDGYAAWFGGNIQTWGFINATGDICTSVNGWKCLSQMPMQQDYPCQCRVRLTRGPCANGSCGHGVYTEKNCGNGWETTAWIQGAYPGIGDGPGGYSGVSPCH